MKKIILIVFGLVFLVSCSNIFNSIFLPNQCKKCELINLQTNEVLFTNTGCGGDNTKLEEEAQLKAYELSRGAFGLCDLEVRCESWRKEKDDQE
jgi:ABC-type lipoprotein release transport system permease subunit